MGRFSRPLEHHAPYSPIVVVTGTDLRLSAPATDCIAVCELASCVAGAFLSAHQSAHQPQRKEHCMTFARTYA